MSRKKTRPQKGDPITAGMSQRDIAATGVMSRRQIQQALAVARIPEDEFESLIESDNPPSVSKLADIGRGRDPALRRARYCPHCGEKLTQEKTTDERT